MTTRRARLFAAGLAVAVGLSLVAACGGGGDEETTPADTSAETTAQTGAAADTGASTEASGALPNLDYARGQIEQYRAIPEFVAPGPPFDATAAVAGKTMFSIPASSAVPFVQTIQDGLNALAGEVGLQFTDWPNQGQPNQWVQGMDTAVNQQVNLINLLAGINPASLGPQITAAKNAGIPTLVSHLYDVNQTPAPDVYTVDILYEQAGRLLADWVIAETEGKTHTLVITINEVVSTEPMVAGIKDEFATYCGEGCKQSYINVGIPEIATRIQPQVQTALTADPEINYIIALYDSAEAPFAVAGIKAVGAEDRVKVATFNGTPDVLKMVQDEDIVAMDIGENLEWIAYGVMDQAMRILGGEEPVENENLPLRIFDDSNIDEAGTPPALSTGYGDAYVNGYRELWGLTQ